MYNTTDISIPKSAYSDGGGGGGMLAKIGLSSWLGWGVKNKLVTLMRRVGWRFG